MLHRGKGLWHDLGYLAAYIQLWAATTFWISTLTGLPGVIPGFPENGSVAIVDVFFWLPQWVSVFLGGLSLKKEVCLQNTEIHGLSLF